MIAARSTYYNLLVPQTKARAILGVLITSPLSLIDRLTERAKKRRTSSQTIGQTLSNSRQEDTGPTQVRQDASH